MDKKEESVVALEKRLEEAKALLKAREADIAFLGARNAELAKMFHVFAEDVRITMEDVVETGKNVQVAPEQRIGEMAGRAKGLMRVAEAAIGKAKERQG